MTDQSTIELHLQVIHTLNMLADNADKFIKRNINKLYWQRQKKYAQANSAYIYQRFINPRPENYKTINVGFILLNKDKMTLQQMAVELCVSITKIKSTMKEYKIEYKPKRHNY